MPMYSNSSSCPPKPSTSQQSPERSLQMHTRVYFGLPNFPYLWTMKTIPLRSHNWPAANAGRVAFSLKDHLIAAPELGSTREREGAERGLDLCGLPFR